MIPAPKILTVHGVGNPRTGQIARSLRANLYNTRPEAEIHEFDWNSIVVQPVLGSNLHVTTLEELGSRLARASSLCNADDAWMQRYSVYGKVVRTKDVLFVASEAIVATTFSLVFLMMPFFVGLVLIINLTDADIESIMRSTFVVAWAWTMLTVRSLGAFLIFATLGQLACITAMCAITKKLESIAIWFRQIGILALRPVILGAFAPAALPWRSIQEEALLPITIFAIPVFLLTVFALYRLAFAIFWTRDFYGISSGLGILATLIGIPVVIYLLPKVFVRSIHSPLKVLLDIFRYTSDPFYRKGLQEALHNKIEVLRSAGGGPFELLVLAHSLGSVIALDSLVNDNCWRRSDCITLVTLGSPLRRFFFRFFPRLYFPSDANSSAKIIGSRVFRFRWLNCYRPWDQVGAKIGLEIPHSTAEVSTGQWRRVLNAHPDYWTDSVVRDRIEYSLENLSFFQSAEDSSGDFVSVPPIFDLRFRAILAGVFASMLTAAVFLLPPTLCIRDVFSKVQAQNARLANNQEILATGIGTDATITYWVSDVSVSESHITVHEKLLFEYTDQASVAHRIQKSIKTGGTFEDVRYIADVDSLISYVKKEGRQLSGKGLPRIKCKNIKIKFLASEPRLFVVTQFPPSRPEALQNGLDIFYRIWPLFFCVPVLFYLLRRTVLNWLRLLLGERLLLEVPVSGPAAFSRIERTNE